MSWPQAGHRLRVALTACRQSGQATAANTPGCATSAAVTRRYLEELRTEPETIEARLGRFLTHYDDNLVRHENAAEVAQPGVFAAVACPDCRQAVNATLRRCPACGQDMDS